MFRDYLRCVLLLISVAIGYVEVTNYHCNSVDSSLFGQAPPQDSTNKKDSWSLLFAQCKEIGKLKPTELMTGYRVLDNCTKVPKNTPICYRGSSGRAVRGWDNCAIFMGECDNKSYRAITVYKNKVASMFFRDNAGRNENSKHFYTIRG